MMRAIAHFGAALAMGLALAAGNAAAAPAGLAGSLQATDMPTAARAPLEQVKERWPRRSGRGSITLHFGGGPRYHGPRYYDGPRHYVPRYHAPRYYAPRYYQPRYEEPRHYRPSRASAHVRWCSNRYRSYRAWDNSFQPYHGGRRQCVSPYF